MTILRMSAVHDEADVLRRNLDWYAEAGFPTVLVCNRATEECLEICAAAVRAGQVAAVRRLETEGYEWKRVLHTLLELAREQRPEHVMLTAPDEFFELPDGGDLRAAMEEDFAAGHNVIDFTEMEFQMTVRDDPAEPDALTRMRWYTCRATSMKRAYPCLPGLEISSTNGHRPAFPVGVERRPSPRVYIARHYPLRTVEQAERKLKRLLDPPSSGRRHYVRFIGGSAEVQGDVTRLYRYDDDHRWQYKDRMLRRRLKETETALLRLTKEHAVLKARLAELEPGTARA